MKKIMFFVAALLLSTIMFSCDKNKKTDPKKPVEEEEEVYPEIGARNCILLEEFTGQKCPNCPPAIEEIHECLQAMMNGTRVAWVAHHSGYGDDYFTLKGDNDLASVLFYGYCGYNYTFAPAGCIDRSKTYVVTSEGPEDDYIHHASYCADTVLLNGMLAVPAEASISMKTTLVDNLLTITLTGKCNKDNAYVTIFLCQNGIQSVQSGVSGTYTHNDVIRAYLTASKGDKLTIDGDKKYKFTTSYEIPAEISGVMNKAFATDIPNMFVVATIHGSTTSKGAIYNTEMVHLSTLR